MPQRATARRSAPRRFEHGFGHVLLTGAAGAIGAALAHAFARSETQLTLWDIDLDRLRSLAEHLDAAYNRVDITDGGALPEHFAAASAARPIDVLINCAGIMDVSRLETQPWATSRRILDIDLAAPLQLMQLAAGPMLERGAGLVVNIGSMAGMVPLKGCAVYGAAKAGLAMASEITRAEWADRGVDVVTVYPGAITSPLEAGARAAFGDSRWQRYMPSASPESLADAIIETARAGRPRLIHPRPLSWIAPPFGAMRRFTARFGPRPAR